jgi:hypothetical protein
MTAITSSTCTVAAHESLPMTKRCSQTLKSIKKLSPSPTMATGTTNPLLLHAVNDDLFPRVWSFLAEVMLVDGALMPSTKESISWLVNAKRSNAVRVVPKQTSSSKKGKSPLDMDPFEAAVHSEAMKYAERLLSQENDDLMNISSGSLSQSNNGSVNAMQTLSRSGKAETALVVVLFSHLNRATKALLGE